MQKDFKAGRLVVAPKAKASALVRDVIVMAGPECPSALTIRSLVGCVKLVWSSELQRTNISSAPIPTSKNGMS